MNLLLRSLLSSVSRLIDLLVVDIGHESHTKAKYDLWPHAWVTKVDLDLTLSQEVSWARHISADLTLLASCEAARSQSHLFKVFLPFQSFDHKVNRLLLTIEPFVDHLAFSALDT